MLKKKDRNTVDFGKTSPLEVPKNSGARRRLSTEAKPAPDTPVMKKGRNSSPKLDEIPGEATPVATPPQTPVENVKTAASTPAQAWPSPGQQVVKTVVQTPVATHVSVEPITGWDPEAYASLEGDRQDVAVAREFHVRVMTEEGPPLREARSGKLDPSMVVASYDTVQAALSFYSQPWKTVLFTEGAGANAKNIAPVLQAEDVSVSADFLAENVPPPIPFMAGDRFLVWNPTKAFRPNTASPNLKLAACLMNPASGERISACHYWQHDGPPDQKHGIFQLSGVSDNCVLLVRLYDPEYVGYARVELKEGSLGEIPVYEIPEFGPSQILDNLANWQECSRDLHKIHGIALEAEIYSYVAGDDESQLVLVENFEGDVSITAENDLFLFPRMVGGADFGEGLQVRFSFRARSGAEPSKLPIRSVKSSGEVTHAETVTIKPEESGEAHFDEEIFFRLPLVLEPDAQLSVELLSATSGECISECAISLFLSDVLLDDGAHSLTFTTISDNKKARMLSPRGNMYLKYETRIRTSLYLQDSHTQHVVNDMSPAALGVSASKSKTRPTSTDEDLERAFRKLERMSPEVEKRNFPILLCSLMRVASATKMASTATRVRAVEHALQLLARVSPARRSAELASFVSYMYHPEQDDVHEGLVQALNEAFSAKSTLTTDYVWVLLDVVTKSMAIQKSRDMGSASAVPKSMKKKQPSKPVSLDLLAALDDLSMGVAPPSTPPSGKIRKSPDFSTPAPEQEDEGSPSSSSRFCPVARAWSSEFQQDISKLLAFLVPRALTPDLVGDLGYFVYCLMSLMDRGYVMSLVKFVLEGMDEGSRQSRFLGCVLRTPEFRAINESAPISMSTSVTIYRTASSENRPLVSLLLDRVELDLNQDGSSRNAQLLYEMLLHHSARGDSEEIVGWYFPYILACISRVDKIEARLQHGHQKVFPWLLSFLHIASASPESLLRQWWEVASAGSRTAFFQVMRMAAKRVGTVAVRNTQLDILRRLMVAHTGVFETLADLMQGLQVRDAALFEVTSKLLDNAGPQLFSEGSKAATLLTPPLLDIFNRGDVALRNDAVALLLRLIQLNFQSTAEEGFPQMKLACTVAVSRLVTSDDDKGNLELGLEELVTLAASDSRLAADVKGMAERLFSVIRSSEELGKFEADPEMKVGVCYRISDGYARSPDLRMTWIKIIADLHTKNKKQTVTEAAQCHMVAAFLIYQYLSKNGTLPEYFRVTEEDMARYCPALSSEEFRINDEDMTNKLAMRLACWSIKGLLEHLRTAAELLEEAHLYQHSLHYWGITADLTREAGLYLELLGAHSAAQMLCKKHLKDKSGRPEDKYFRVVFIGSQMEHLNGTAFVYKEPASTRLMDFTARIMGQCQANLEGYGVSAVEKLGNNKEVTDELKQQTEKLYVQISRIYPVSGRQFYLDLAHSDQKKQQQAVAMQGRKKLIFTAKHAFPHIQARVEIVDTQLVILTPLQNAVQLMEDRVAALADAVAQVPPSATVISGILYGNLMTSVAEGPEAVAEAFLGDNAKGEEGEKKLQSLMQAFVDNTKDALALHETLMSTEMRQWQDTALERFELLKSKLAPFL